ncbi:hypothetical protein M3Y98_01182600 [Aphelenchoides besseyi]|nr:hypothetical protein M3Y98_01182600 [Aphelenchoides besseyi]KAI6211091.1 hypothetical protein M3Y96_00396300 [Aphelenchoides besseyi]
MHEILRFVAFVLSIYAVHSGISELGSGEQIYQNENLSQEPHTYISNNIYIIRDDQFTTHHLKHLPSKRAASADSFSSTVAACSRLMSEFENDEAEFERFIEMYGRMKQIFKEQKSSKAHGKSKDVVIAHIHDALKSHHLNQPNHHVKPKFEETTHVVAVPTYSKTSTPSMVVVNTQLTTEPQITQTKTSTTTQVAQTKSVVAEEESTIRPTAPVILTKDDTNGTKTDDYPEFINNFFTGLKDLVN